MSTTTSPALMHGERVRKDQLQGQDVVHMSLPSGDSAIVALHGAQVVSWTTGNGAERLFLSPKAHWDGQSAVRGGVPICFPQFNQRGPLVKHGFARNRTWSFVGATDDVDSVTAVFALHDDAETRLAWPHGFEVKLRVLLTPGQLRMTLELENTGSDAWSFTGALHTYLQVPEISQLQLEGLEGLARWDAVRDVHDIQQQAVRFDGEYDSVFAPVQQPMLLRDADSGFALRIENSANWGNVVVWNPGAALCAQLADMPSDGYRHMLCVEAACVDSAVTLQPGERWIGWQQLQDLSRAELN